MTIQSGIDWSAIPVKVGVTADPAAGSPAADITVPMGKRWLLLGIRTRIACDATVANRYCNIFVMPDGTTTFIRVSPGVAVAASQTATVWCARMQSAQYNESSGGWTYVANGIESDVPAGGIVRVQWTNLQAGDNIEAVSYIYKEAPA